MHFAHQVAAMSCTCCGAAGRTRRGCSCTGGKSHQCLRLASSVASSASTVVDEPASVQVVASTWASDTESEPEGEPKTKAAMMKTYIISIPDSPEGIRRRSMRGKLGPNQEYTKGYQFHELPSEFAASFAGRHRGVCRESSIACLYSHIKVWAAIADSEEGCLVLEDDAEQVRHFDIELLTSSLSVILLGGALRGKEPWNQEKATWISNGQYAEVISGLEKGLNNLSEVGARFTGIFIITIIIIVIINFIIIAMLIIILMLMTGSIAYYMPPIQARVMMCHIEILMEQGKKLRVTDIFMGSAPIHIKVLFPNPFAEMCNSVSQCNSPDKDGGCDLYMTREMQIANLDFFQLMLTRFPHVELFSIATASSLPPPLFQLM